MYYIGIDIGSTCSKTAVLTEEGAVRDLFVVPTGWSSKEALRHIIQELETRHINISSCPAVSTGYGRNAVDFAIKQVTEITCHGRGAYYLIPAESCHVIDIGGQDTKVMSCKRGRVMEFYMNDKCSAGTGKFIEVMANRMGVSPGELDELARQHTKPLEISAMCTVFAESEIISLMGSGESRENIAYGILQSVVRKVRQEYAKLQSPSDTVILTGGLCRNVYLLELLSQNFGRDIRSHVDACYAGAIGAALIAQSL